MMRFFLLGLLLPVFAFADTIPKQTLYGYTGKPNTFTTASAAAAAAYLEIDPGTGYTKESGPYVSGTNCTGTSFAVASIVAYYANNFYGLSCRNSGFTITSSLGCPEGYTPDSNGSTCTRPDCPDGQIRQADGTCKAPNKCEGKDSTPPTFAWVSFNKGNSPYGMRCKDGCQVAQSGPVSHPTLNPDGDFYVGGTADFHQLMKTQYFAVECTVGQDGAVAPEPTTPPEKAPRPLKRSRHVMRRRGC